jgi:hypothetical protein
MSVDAIDPDGRCTALHSAAIPNSVPEPASLRRDGRGSATPVRR